MSDRENNGEEKMVVHVVIPIKLPLFSKANPNLWFARAEMLLDGDRIVSDASRFRQVVKCLDDEILDLVSDILAPPAANKYQTLKNHIVGLFRESEDERTQRFLRGEANMRQCTAANIHGSLDEWAQQVEAMREHGHEFGINATGISKPADQAEQTSPTMPGQRSTLSNAEGPGQHRLLIRVPIPEKVEVGKHTRRLVRAVNDCRRTNRLHVFDKRSGIRFLVDTGAEVSVLPRSVVRRAGFSRACAAIMAVSSDVSICSEEVVGDRALTVDTLGGKTERTTQNYVCG
ncbi:unnamed protein product [Lasius platythorax]|uniref:Peptidase A2 domain-containing protein n=1 Tax=Lasius platythorax TaxID=488582 RepID=A0AAV2NF08_9HYME